MCLARPHHNFLFPSCYFLSLSFYESFPYCKTKTLPLTSETFMFDGLYSTLFKIFNLTFN